MGTFPVGKVDEGAGAELMEGWLCGFRAAPFQLIGQCLLLPGLAHLYTFISQLLEWSHVLCTYAGDLSYN